MRSPTAEAMAVQARVSLLISHQNDSVAPKAGSGSLVLGTCVPEAVSTMAVQGVNGPARSLSFLDSGFISNERYWRVGMLPAH